MTNYADYLMILLIAVMCIAISSIVSYQYGFQDGTKTNRIMVLGAYDDLNNNHCDDHVEAAIWVEAATTERNITKWFVFDQAWTYYSAYDKLIGCCDYETFNRTCGLEWNRIYMSMVYPPRWHDD